MNCPLCIDQTLDVTHRRGLELDICPKCRGIWLDRGEIDRLLGEDDSPPASERSTSPPIDQRDRSNEKSSEKKRKKKKKSLAERIGDAIEDAIDELT